MGLKRLLKSEEVTCFEILNQHLFTVVYQEEMLWLENVLYVMT